MPNHALSPDSPEVIEAAAALARHGGNQSRAAAECGVHRATFQNRLRHARKEQESNIVLPEFPDDDIPIGDIIKSMARRNRKRRESFAAHTWFKVQVTDPKPIGVMFFGDPHVDDPHCDWDLLQEHAEISKQDGIYGVNIGDTTNCWGGRLIRKYADQDTSLKTARRLAEWFLLDSGVRWLVWLYGNHEHMGDGSAILGEMAKRFGTQKIVMHDWEARFSIAFPNGREIKTFCAHDFSGNSMWNPLHGPVKAARFGGDVDLLVAGHKHNWAVSQWELAEKGTVPLMIRVRGYKSVDDFARSKGYLDQVEGASILAVLNPNASTRSGTVMPFVDVAAGADYLAWLRKKAK